MFVVTLGGLNWNDTMILKLGSVALSGFFTYEVCRKLDPTHLKVRIIIKCTLQCILFSSTDQGDVSCHLRSSKDFHYHSSTGGHWSLQFLHCWLP